MKYEQIIAEDKRMIVMDLQVDNFMALKNFHMNMSYPKKIVGSQLEEHLAGVPSFRYKKIVILMGGNSTGKTSIGRIMMMIFNFMDKKIYNGLTDMICDKSKQASFSIDFVGNRNVLYRVEAAFMPPQGEDYQSTDINVNVRSVSIGKKDSYKTCIERLEQEKEHAQSSYIEELEKIEGLSWSFEYPSDYLGANKTTYHNYTEKNLKIMELILQTLDPAIIKVEKSDEIENTFIIRYTQFSVIVQNGEILNPKVLSSGTRSGIEVAEMLASILEDKFGFYYCDEKFSYIHSEVEKAILSLMIEGLDDNGQLFFTTHNTDILDLPLPKHSFVFLKKDITDTEQPIKCISASTLLKRSTDSVKNAVENDLFSISPNITKLYEIETMYQG